MEQFAETDSLTYLMNHRLNFKLLLSLICLLGLSLNAQTKKTSIKQLLGEIKEQERQLRIKCPPAGIRISNFCYELCPVMLVKPRYSDEARRLRISGIVRIGVIVNEQGKVIYARIAEGKALSSQSARRAAERSEFEPKRNCDNQPIKFRGTIVYNFH